MGWGILFPAQSEAKLQCVKIPDSPLKQSPDVTGVLGHLVFYNLSVSRILGFQSIDYSDFSLQHCSQIKKNLLGIYLVSARK